MNARQKAEKDLQDALRTIKPPSPAKSIVVAQIEAGNVRSNAATIVWRFLGSSWPNDRPIAGGRPPLHEYEITVSAPGDAENTRFLADQVLDVLIGIKHGYAALGETTRIDEAGWTAEIDYAVTMQRT